jgi:hypothetical protein
MVTACQTCSSGFGGASVYCDETQSRRRNPSSAGDGAAVRRRAGVKEHGMSEEDRAILVYVKRAQDNPSLFSDVQFDAGPYPGETHLRARLARAGLGEPPDALACEPEPVYGLIGLGYLDFRDPWLTLTTGGVKALAEPASQ